MFIYGLFDSSGELRYVGQTVKSVEKRLREHLWPSCLKKAGHKNNWLKALLAKNERPSVQVLQVLGCVKDLTPAERYWISFFKAQGCRLVNDTSGGEGLRNPSPETRARMSASMKGRPSSRKGVKVSEETKEKLRQANLGKRASAETRAKISKAHIGKPCVNPEALRAGRLGWKASPEQRENMRKAAQLREFNKKQTHKEKETWSQK